ncbi:MAG: hypothetical protein SVU32_01210 [Candidatus Nanohaloarchaea archaeon]|nr:hypothetical protein [Candidatus Nanohaloarchaea archaeon]
MPYDTDGISENELDQRQDYFERIYLLDHVADLRPEQMLEDDLVQEHVDHEEQLSYDLERIEAAVDELDEEYSEPFQEIDGIQDELEAITGEYPEAGTGIEQISASELTEQVEEYVEQSIAHDEELGFETDSATHLFYAKSHEQQLRCTHDVTGVVDPTYVLDLLE